MIRCGKAPFEGRTSGLGVRSRKDYQLNYGVCSTGKTERCYILPGFLILPLSYMDFLIFVGEVIWALAGFLDLLKKIR
jgi:hypothetical protein